MKVNIDLARSYKPYRYLVPVPVDLARTRTRLSAPVEFEVLEYKVILAWPNSASLSSAVIVKYKHL